MQIGISIICDICSFALLFYHKCLKSTVAQYCLIYEESDEPDKTHLPNLFNVFQNDVHYGSNNSLFNF